MHVPGPSHCSWLPGSRRPSPQIDSDAVKFPLFRFFCPGTLTDPVHREQLSTMVARRRIGPLTPGQLPLGNIATTDVPFLVPVKRASVSAQPVRESGAFFEPSLNSTNSGVTTPPGCAMMGFGVLTT